ncbi:hypothetical protein PWE35_09420 [Stenotrophomonas maltophilia]|uniref:hypothetical protein n=1 Tax=Stenotrophomonas maltophilia TaxID=40324 RepID=UPI00237F1FF7|nr:hypothetical protein [Stenotrophomonas maltophilia]WDW06042.1 hypothetical protein PWE35_09420 [Stenotrophomonas maltophilia]
MRSIYAVASATITAASTTDIGSADGEYVQVNGSGTINSFGTGYPGCKREVLFNGSPTIVNSSNILLPQGLNLSVTSGDVYTFRCTFAGVWVLANGSVDRRAVRKTGDEMSGALSLRGGGVATNKMEVFHNAGVGVDFGAVVRLTNPGSTTSLGESIIVPVGANGYLTEYQVFLKSGDFFGSPLIKAMWVDGSGNVTAAGTLISNSDEGLKEDWKPVRSDLVECLAGLKSGDYMRKDLGVRQIGVGAQSLEEFLPLAVQKDGDGVRSVAYGNAALVGVVALARRVLELEARIGA